MSHIHKHKDLPKKSRKFERLTTGRCIACGDDKTKECKPDHKGRVYLAHKFFHTEQGCYCWDCIEKIYPKRGSRHEKETNVSKEA